MSLHNSTSHGESSKRWWWEGFPAPVSTHGAAFGYNYKVIDFGNKKVELIFSRNASDVPAVHSLYAPWLVVLIWIVTTIFIDTWMEWFENIIDSWFGFIMGVLIRSKEAFKESTMTAL